MGNILRQFRNQSAFGAILTILFGLVLLIAPSAVLSLVLGVLGWILLIMGIAGIISFFVNRSVYASYGQLISGIAELLIGLWVVRSPGGVVSLVGTLVGILMLVHAVMDLQYVYDAYRAGAANWWTAAVSGGLTLVLALLVLFRPFGSVLSVLSLAGICLIVDGVCDLIMLHRLGDLFR